MIVAFHVLHHVMHVRRVGDGGSVAHYHILEGCLFGINHGIRGFHGSPIILAEIIRFRLHVIYTNSFNLYRTSGKRSGSEAGSDIHQVDTRRHTGKQDRIGDAIDILITQVFVTQIVIIARQGRFRNDRLAAHRQVRLCLRGEIKHLSL